jgi:hypothetical protein
MGPKRVTLWSPSGPTAYFPSLQYRTDPTDVLADAEGVSAWANWLKYAWDWVRTTDRNGYLQMPASRTMRSPLDGKRWYHANTAGSTVPDGLGDEEAIRTIWAGDAGGGQSKN